MGKETVIVLDFGGQYNQLIARRIRDLNVYCEILPYDSDIEKIKAKNPMGIVFTGGPNSVYASDAPMCDEGVFNLGVPILGICYGMQVITKVYFGKVTSCDTSEYGKRPITVKKQGLFSGFEVENFNCWMSHTDYVSSAPKGFEIDAFTDTCPVAAMSDKERKIYAVQFHPEVTHCEYGNEVLASFLFNVCKVSGNWSMENFTKAKIAEIKEEVGDKKVLCALSGGVDSSVAAVLMHEAIGNNLTCIFVDHGLLRKDEGDYVEQVFKEKFNMNFIRVNAADRYFAKLKGVTDPEKKRKIIGEEFIRVFEEEASKLDDITYLLQGTIYPDVVESGSKNAAVIKSHHNVGGLPEDVNFTLIEPLRDLFKDEVRKVGAELGLPKEIVQRQPFPGPGLGIRVLGEVTKEKVEILQNADAIFTKAIDEINEDNHVWQYFAVLPGNRTVGVMGDFRTYDYTIALRAVSSVDGMSADFSRIDLEYLGKIANDIINNVDHVNRVVYDITSKPPGTIEWE